METAAEAGADPQKLVETVAGEARMSLFGAYGVSLEVVDANERRGVQSLGTYGACRRARRRHVRNSLLITALGGVLLLGGLVQRVRRLGKHVRQSQGSRSDDSRAAHLRFTPSNTWVLEHLCRSITTILWGRPGLRRVCFDLARIRMLDASGVALLRYAFRELQKAGVEVDVVGAGSRTMRILLQETRPVADLGAADARRVAPDRTLH